MLKSIFTPFYQEYPTFHQHCCTALVPVKILKYMKTFLASTNYGVLTKIEFP